MEAFLRHAKIIALIFGALFALSFVGTLLDLVPTEVTNAAFVLGLISFCIFGIVSQASDPGTRCKECGGKTTTCERDFGGVEQVSEVCKRCGHSVILPKREPCSKGKG